MQNATAFWVGRREDQSANAGEGNRGRAHRARLQRHIKIIARYPEGKQKSAVIPVLHLAQKEFGGWLDVPVMDYVASILKILPIEVYEVATFYSMYILKPVGKYMF